MLAAKTPTTDRKTQRCLYWLPEKEFKISHWYARDAHMMQPLLYWTILYVAVGI